MIAQVDTGLGDHINTLSAHDLKLNLIGVSLLQIHHFNLLTLCSTGQ
jgi:hypothetical protein